MTPNFALLLSVDGIVLLHRVQDGWHRAGSVSLEVGDLDAAMADLHKKATELAPDDVRTKLVLPNDQIRYLAIETARTSLDDIHTAIAEATPLALDEMVIDFDRSGGRTHIAAVAKQTLQEAEAFAQVHSFAPVSFAANAEAYTFTGEVFFGPTTYARETLEIGADVARDDIPAVETGVVADLEETTPVSEPEVEINAVADATKLDASTEPDAANDDVVPVFASRNRSTDVSAEPPIDTPIARFNRSGKTVVSVEDIPTTEDDAPAIPSPIVAVPPKRQIATGDGATPPLAAPTAFRKRPRSKPAAPTSPVDLALAKGIAKSDARSGIPFLGLAMTAGLVFVMAIAGIWASNRMEGGVAGLLEVDPGLQEDGTEVAAPIVVAPIPEPTETETAQVPQIEEDTPPTPIVTAIPGRVLSPADAARIYAATGVWQRAPRLPGIPEPVTITSPQGIHTFDVVAAVQDIPKPGTPDVTVLGHDLPILTPLNPAPPNRPLPRDEDGFIRAAANGTVLPTGVWIFGRAPAKRPPLRPTDEPVGLDDASVPTVQEEIVTALQLIAFTSNAELPPTRAFVAPSLSQPLPVVPPSADAPQWLPAARALISSPAPAPVEAGPNITDVLAAAPETPAEATQNAPDAELAATPEVAPGQQSPAQSVAALADTPFGTPAPAPTEQDLFDAPEGFVEVILGRPAIVPPLRPGTPEVAPDTDVAEAPTSEGTTPDVPVADEAIFQDARLSGFRPQGRPADLLPPSAATFEAIPTLAGFRPSLRPDDLAPAPVEDIAEDGVDAPTDEDTAVASATDISAIVATIAAAAPPSQIVNPTRSAIVASPRPDTRPQNFARVVSSAQALQQRQETRSAAASTSAAVAQQPAPATAPATGGQTAVTVARAATVDNAIRLRDMNLIGVYGKPGARRALVRMPNGRFVKVEVGSNLDGGRVTAIGDSALNFVKRGQTYALQLPAG